MPVIDDAIARAAREVDLVDVGAAARSRLYTSTRPIGAEARCDADVAVIGELRDASAVGIGGVDFLVPAARGDKGDFECAMPLLPVSVSTISSAN